MYNSYKVTFDDTSPTLNDLVNKILDVTGLSIIYNDDDASIMCKDNNLSLGIERDTYLYTIFLPSPYLDYLLVSTIFSLIKLGGTYSGFMPQWAGKKWNEVQYLI